jgi:hypothetical protein
LPPKTKNQKKKRKKRLLGLVVVWGSSMIERSYLQLKSFICTRALNLLSIIIIIIRVCFCILCSTSLVCYCCWRLFFKKIHIAPFEEICQK